MQTEKIILGIDPGTTIMGFGMLCVKQQEMKLLYLDEIHFERTADHSLRLKRIFARTLAIIDEYKPDELAIEAPFYGKNAQSMLKLGRAQGVAMAAGLYREVPIAEYSPRKIKMAITGNGNAGKRQVAGMLQHLLKVKALPERFDATDGLAVAVCHHFNAGKPEAQKNYSGWQSFLKENPERKG
ncbi:MAG: crossover junction endodeoxyribonuclease RuvC [Flavobacteriales bacterium]